MNETPHTSPFEAIRRVRDDDSEYWSARDLSKILQYKEWRNFTTAIEKAKEACQNSGHAVSDHFVEANKLIKAGKGAKRPLEDYHLSRYACYLIVQNADPSKPIVAVGQTYFAVQTRRQELADELALANLPEDQKRLIYRSEMAILNTRLADAARLAGVLEPRDFATFEDHGYMGLYKGLRENDIHSRKHLTERQKILDWMESDELAANIFRASLTRQRLEKEQVKGKDKANVTHYRVGRIVRQAIEEAGGTMPEDLPTPQESIQELQRKEQKRLKQGPQESLFDEPQSTNEE
jgi:DNA-damage-inducible protein D